MNEFSNINGIEASYMDVYIIHPNQLECCNEQNWYHEEEEFFVVGTQEDIHTLQRIFSFSHEAIEVCLYKDESVRLRNFEGYDFISFKYLNWDIQYMESIDLNLIVGQNYVILIGEDAPQIVEQIKDYIIKKMNPPFTKRKSLNKIYYLIWEWLITHYSNIMVEIEDTIENIEGELAIASKEEHFHQIYYYRKIIRKIKRYIRPLLYIGDELIVNDNHTIRKDMIRYFKNIDVRINKLYDFVEDLQDTADQVRRIYDSRLAARTNKIAVNITVLAAFLTPLTVITGLYGMNFDFMPELHWKYGYLFAICLMILSVSSIYYWLKKNGWITK